MGVFAWTHLANGEGRCPPLCGPDTKQCSPGAPLAQWKGRVSREVRIGQAGRGREADGRRHLLRDRVQGKGKGKWREANRCR